MSTTIESLADAAMQLSPDDREMLVERLLASLEGPALHPAWEAELARRVADMNAGRIRFTPANEAMARLADHIYSRRPAG